MQISLNWLNDYLDLKNEKPEEIGLRFTMASAEIEEVVDLAKPFAQVVTAKILEISPHPDADKLQVTKVDNGHEILQVVCGAKNIAVGQIVPLAQIGAVLPGDFRIKQSNKRGVESFGMLCSGSELGIASDVDGIHILPEHTPIGIPFADISGKNDQIIDIDNKSLTHRPDLWGHYGIARELAAILKKDFQKLDFKLPAVDSEEVKINISVENSELCRRYSAMAFAGIKIGESPEWLKQRLINTGNKPINNVVDATNYIMFELGQPLHSFDGKKIKDQTIIIRNAREGETLITLDNVERELSPDMLVIADPDKPIALAGVMGNQNTEVDSETTMVILEAANFHPGNVRKTALKCGLRTEASARFEKSLDPEMTVQAIARFYQLLRETCPELRVVSKLSDFDYSQKETILIEIEHDFINRRLGTTLEKTFVADTLNRLGFSIEEKKPGFYQVKVPSYRSTKDISIPEDLVEELGRIYGYDNIPPEAPNLPIKPLEENPLQILRKNLRESFSFAFGFSEIYNYSFNGSAQLEKLDLSPEKHISLQNPLSREQEFLRTSLIPNMLEAVITNFKHSNSFKIYEIGKVFLKEEKTEKEYLCAMIAEKKPIAPLFYQMKGYAEAMLEKQNLSDYEIVLPESIPGAEYHPSRTAVIRQRKSIIGYISEIHPKVLQRFDLNGRVGFIYLDIEALLKSNRKKTKFKELPKYPHVPFDVSVFTDSRTLVADVEKTIKNVNKQLIRDVELFDIYEGKNLPEGKKSLAFTVNFYSPERTLEPNEIRELQEKIMSALNEKGYEVRGS